MSKTTVIVGSASIFFTSLTVLTMIFPALFSSIFGRYSENLNPIEIGVYAIPVLLINTTLLIFGFFYYRNKLSPSLISAINAIRSFEISKKISLVVLIIIFGIYIGLSTPELFLDESLQWGDFGVVLDALEIWPFGESENVYVQEQNDRYVRMFLLDSSLNVFQNIKLLPFVASILLLFVTYLLTVQITEKRFAGIIALVVLIHSSTFLKFDTVAVYENFWVLFYLLSLYVIQRKWILSPIFYILSFFTKAFVAPYFIMTLFFVGNSNISNKAKLGLLVSYIAVVGISVVIIFSGDTIYPSVIEVDYSKFFVGIANFAPLLRYDMFLLMTILPVVIGLTFLGRNSSTHSNSILFLILGTLLAGPILIVFTNFYEILPYRYMPLIVFFAIGVGMFFSKKPIS